MKNAFRNNIIQEAEEELTSIIEILEEEKLFMKLSQLDAINLNACLLEELSILTTTNEKKENNKFFYKLMDNDFSNSAKNFNKNHPIPFQPLTQLEKFLRLLNYFEIIFFKLSNRSNANYFLFHTFLFVDLLNFLLEKNLNLPNIILEKLYKKLNNIAQTINIADFHKNQKISFDTLPFNSQTVQKGITKQGLFNLINNKKINNVNRLKTITKNLPNNHESKTILTNLINLNFFNLTHFLQT